MNDSQLDLFAPPAAPFYEPALIELGASLPDQVAFGTSSWTFPGWVGLVYERPYPSQRQLARDSLAEYARHPLFRTVGIDSTYYRPATAETLRHYAAQLPDGFRCLMKVHSDITTFVYPDHERAGARRNQANPHFLDATRFRDTVHAAVTASGFEPHLAAYVLELPSSHGRLDPEQFVRKLERFFAHAPPGRFAVELREPRLLTEAYLKVLDAAGATHVFNYHSRMPTLAEQWTTVLDRLGRLPGDQMIARLLQPQRTNYDTLKQRYAPFNRIVSPDPVLRADVLLLIGVAAQQGARAFVIVNNKAEGSAPLTVRALAELVRDEALSDPLAR